jgi:hypothetical protein
MFEATTRHILMSDSIVDDQLRAHADRLRALEDQNTSQRRLADDGFEGVREYSRAWHENRATAYLLRKSWADPIARTLFLIGIIVIACGWAYLLMQ